MRIIRRALKWKAVGHAGTLDPSATGVLLVLCGDATSRADEFMALPKEYVARIRFGLTTATDDFEGEVLEWQPLDDWTVDRIESALKSFSGHVQQVPPAVSAVKIAGRPSYRLARSGSEPTHSPRAIEIHDITLLSQCRPEILLRIRCSRGTYIRSLARDLGRQLGWGGTLAELRRTAIGDYHDDFALKLPHILAHHREFSQG